MLPVQGWPIALGRLVPWRRAEGAEQSPARAWQSDAQPLASLAKRSEVEEGREADPREPRPGLERPSIQSKTHLFPTRAGNKGSRPHCCLLCSPGILFLNMEAPLSHLADSLSPCISPIPFQSHHRILCGRLSSGQGILQSYALQGLQQGNACGLLRMHNKEQEKIASVFAII